MLKGFKIQLKPNKEQENLFNKHVGCCRFVYNHALADGKEYYDMYNCFLPINMLITELPALKTEFPRLKEIDATALQQILRDQNQAFQNFFKHKSGFPKFKSKHKDRPSFRMINNNNCVRFQNQKI